MLKVKRLSLKGKVIAILLGVLLASFVYQYNNLLIVAAPSEPIPEISFDTLEKVPEISYDTLEK
jgi:hypothetical protein